MLKLCSEIKYIHNYISNQLGRQLYWRIPSLQCRFCNICKAILSVASFLNFWFEIWYELAFSISTELEFDIMIQNNKYNVIL